MSIVYSVICLLFFLIALYYHREVNRRKFVLFLFLFYGLLILIAQYNLLILDRFFHPSDPEAYFVGILDLESFQEVINKFSSTSNVYYFALNWLFYVDLNDPLLVSLSLKLTNVLIFLGCYLVSTSKVKFTYIECLILLHPYLLLTALRNVRDLHIFGLIFICMGLISERAGKYKKLIPYILLLISRAFYFIFFLISESVDKRKKSINKKHVILLALFIFILFTFSNSFYHMLLYPVVAGYGFYNDYGGQYGYLLSNIQSFDRSLPFLLSIGTIISIAFVRFIFTPLLPNYMEKYLSSDLSGVFLNIYTDIDMILIFLGVIVNALYFIPLFISRTQSIINDFRTIDAAYIFSLLNLAIYSFAHLGGTDIRVRFSFILAFSLSYVFFNQKVLVSRLYQFLSAIILIILPTIYQLSKLVL